MNAAPHAGFHTGGNPLHKLHEKGVPARPVPVCLHGCVQAPTDSCWWTEPQSLFPGEPPRNLCLVRALRIRCRSATEALGVGPAAPAGPPGLGFSDGCKCKGNMPSRKAVATLLLISKFSFKGNDLSSMVHKFCSCKFAYSLRFTVATDQYCVLPRSLAAVVAGSAGQLESQRPFPAEVERPALPSRFSSDCGVSFSRSRWSWPSAFAGGFILNNPPPPELGQGRSAAWALGARVHLTGKTHVRQASRSRRSCCRADSTLTGRLCIATDRKWVICWLLDKSVTLSPRAKVQ